MAISEKDYFEALRASDQRAVELLAKASAARVSTGMLAVSILVSIISMLVAVFAVVWKH